MSAHAERVYPEECCGLMLGEMESASSPHKQLFALVPVDNQWSAAHQWAKGSDQQPDAQQLHSQQSVEETLTKERRYAIDPKDMLRVQKHARERGLKIIGVYHSHPDHVAIPSECDRAQAWSAYAYPIVSVQKGKAVDIRNWALDSDHQFQPEAMQVIPSSVTDRMPLPA